MDSTDFRLILDAGGFSKGYSNVSELQTEYLVKGFSMLNYDAVNLAIKDFANGGDFIKQLQNKYNTNFVSSNIEYSESQKPFAEPYLTLKLKSNKNSNPPFDHLNVGIFGLCDERERLLHRNDDEAQLESTNPVEAAKQSMAKLKKSDLIVLLFNGRYNTLLEVLDAVPDIDIVIMGGEYYRVQSSNNQKTIVASTPSLGKYFGTLTVVLDQDKQIMSHTTERVALDESIPDNEELARLVEEFDTSRAQARR